jgi:hypothetical protein
MLPDEATGVPFRSTWAALAMPHCKVLLPPWKIVVGDAENGTVIDGHGMTVTVTDWLADCAAQSLLVAITV